MHYVKNRSSAQTTGPAITSPTSNGSSVIQVSGTGSMSGADEIIQMDRMRKLIADHMVMSVQTSPHVTSYVEADMTNIVNWRNKIKNDFLKRENEKIITFGLELKRITCF